MGPKIRTQYLHLRVIDDIGVSNTTHVLSGLTSGQEENIVKQHQLCRQETNLELELLGRKAITHTDLVPSTRNLAALASLYRSIVSIRYVLLSSFNVLICFLVLVRYGTERSQSQT
jgi:hypothetical protein